MSTTVAVATPIQLQPTRVLSDLVAEQGMCVEAEVSAECDPWFPATEVRQDLEDLARQACAGCPVVASCLELTLRLEQGLRRTEIGGIRGGQAPHERVALLHVRRGGGQR